jgi:hypothetical protein
LLALDATTPDGVMTPASWIVIVDDGETVRLVLYADAAGMVATVPLDPRRAVQLAAELTRAASRRLWSAGERLAAGQRDDRGGAHQLE